MVGVTGHKLGVTAGVTQTGCNSRTGPRASPGGHTLEKHMAREHTVASSTGEPGHKRHQSFYVASKERTETFCCDPRRMFIPCH